MTFILTPIWSTELKGIWWIEEKTFTILLLKGWRTRFCKNWMQTFDPTTVAFGANCKRSGIKALWSGSVWLAMMYSMLFGSISSWIAAKYKSLNFSCDVSITANFSPLMIKELYVVPFCRPNSLHHGCKLDLKVGRQAIQISHCRLGDNRFVECATNCQL